MIREEDYFGASIHAPDEFWLVPIGIREGGCGAGKFGDRLVPDSIWGLNITGICKIHDYEYVHGTTQRDKEMADTRFLQNLILWIDYKTKIWGLGWLRRLRAVTYYSAVHEFGDDAYWKGKNA